MTTLMYDDIVSFVYSITPMSVQDIKVKLNHYIASQERLTDTKGAEEKKERLELRYQDVYDKLVNLADQLTADDMGVLFNELKNIEYELQK